MPSLDDDRQDADLPQRAVQALTAAHRRALAAGRTLVLVRNNQLIRISSAGIDVLRQLPARKKVTVRKKVARS
jgi:hypothetical protein